MRHPERASFSWRPSEAIQSFECAVVTDARENDARAYAVTVSVLDGAGDEITPEHGSWLYSSSLERFFQYSPETTDDPTLRLEGWIGETYVDSVHVEVLAWEKSRELPQILAMAFSPAPRSSAATQHWTVLGPHGGTK